MIRVLPVSPIVHRIATRATASGRVRLFCGREGDATDKPGEFTRRTSAPGQQKGFRAVRSWDGVTCGNCLKGM